MVKTQGIFTVLAGLGAWAAGCGGSSSAPAKKSAGTPTTTNKEESGSPFNRSSAGQRSSTVGPLADDPGSAGAPVSVEAWVAPSVVSGRQ
jgi:hypothetical protein